MSMPEYKEGVKQIPVIVPTRDEQGAVARSVAALWNVFFSMGLAPMYIHANCVGYAQVRTQAFKEARKYFPQHCRGLLLDDDILIVDSGEVRDALVLADQNKWNIVAPYRTKNNKICICNTKGEMLTPEEYKLVRPWQQIPMAGLGFYYGDLDLDYVFHADHKPFTGEDLNFFFDQPNLKPRIAPIQLKHLKVIPI